ncbi:MAG: hypothetical protein IPJ46_21045 [Anaerolineales bacterium]|nr:hypothetical protein [Anaerolineales bacterium]
MRINFPSVLNILQSIAANFAFPAVNQKADHGSNVQADVMDQRAADPKLAASKFENEFSVPRWIYRGHYRSIFPPMF